MKPVSINLLSVVIGLIREINKKNIILESRRPFGRETDKYIKEIIASELIFSSNRLDGSTLTPDDTLTIIKGGYLPERTVMDHVSVKNYMETLDKLYDRIEMRDETDVRLLHMIHDGLCGEPSGFRTTNPVLHHINYVPPHFHSINDNVEKLLIWYYGEGRRLNPVLRATVLHCAMIAVYPFEKFTEAAARLTLNYELMLRGYPMISFGISEQDYYQMLEHYIVKQDVGPFYDMVLKSLDNRLNMLLAVTDPGYLSE